MKSTSLISIIIPVYNAEMHLEENVRSLLGQTYSNIEIVYVCDGCTDGSVDILNKYAFDSRLKIYNREENRGAAASRNQGADSSRGEWLIFMDADDIVESDAIEILYKSAVDNMSDMVICAYGNIGEDTSSNRLFDYIKHRVSHYPVFQKGDEIFDLSCLVICNAPFNKLINRRLWNTGHVRFQELKNCNDVYFSIAAFLFSDRVSYVDSRLYRYRKGVSGSLTSKRTNEKSFLLEALDSIRNLIIDRELDERIFQSFAYVEILKSRSASVYREMIEEYYNKFFHIWNVELDESTSYYYVDKERFCGKRVVIYGAGLVGQDYCAELCDCADIVAWVDAKYDGDKIISVDSVSNLDYDYILIATVSDYFADQMKDKLLKMGVDEQKIIMDYPVFMIPEKYSVISTNPEIPV